METTALSSGQLVGCDFSSSPSRHKPIVIATGTFRKGCVFLSNIEKQESLDGFEKWLRIDREWVGAFDFPFGLPRELVLHLGWPIKWFELINHYANLTRSDIRSVFSAFCNSRPAGKKFAHRITDGLSGSSPSMKWVNPPVAFMLHAGVPRLLAAGVHLPGLHPGDGRRVALEGYPGMLAREVLGKRSYKSDNKAKQTPERLIARKDLITALEQGRIGLELHLKVSHAQRDALAGDASGDSLDSVLCLMQAAWATQKENPKYGLPLNMDELEGWIISA